MIKVALAGNPNSGKTTLFNVLTGSSQYVGNWPGVTVSKKEGYIKKNKNLLLVDLPGIYSLSPYTLEEVVARNYIIDEKPDVIINIIDTTNLERSLYLTSQLLELDTPMIICLNMIDIIRKHGDEIDIKYLESFLGHKVIEISALRNIAIEEIPSLIENAKTQSNYFEYNQDVETLLEKIIDMYDIKILKRFYSVKLFEKDAKVIEKLGLKPELKLILDEFEKKYDEETESIIIDQRYKVITNNVKHIYLKRDLTRVSTTTKIDKIVTNKYLGIPIFLIIMYFVYTISVGGGGIGSIMTTWVNDVLFGQVISNGITNLFLSLNVSGWIIGLVVDGALAGVGAVLGFVPQLFILYLMLSFLEQLGYMSRVAFVLDKVFRKFGLSGKSFIPMIIGTGCSVTGISASRTIESVKDRRMTIITTSFIPCSAKVVIIAMFAGAMFGGSALIATSAYVIGVLSVLLTALIMKKTKFFSGEDSPFVMELPNYHLPSFRSVFTATWERSWSFIKKAFTIILASAIILWFLQSFGFENGLRLVTDSSKSILASFGKLFAVLFVPVGFGDWQSVVATITGLIAKENVVNTFGVLFSSASASSEAGLWAIIAAHYTQISAYSFLLFNLLCTPCFATMSTIKTELNDNKLYHFTIFYQIAFAYSASFVFYSFASVLTGTTNFGLFTILAILVVMFYVYLVFRRDKSKDVEGVR